MGLGEWSWPHPNLPLSALLDFRNSRTGCDWLGMGGPRGQDWVGLFWMPLPHSPQQRVLKFSLFLSDSGLQPHPQMFGPSVSEITGATHLLSLYFTMSFFPLLLCLLSLLSSRVNQASTLTSACDAARLDPTNSSCLCQSSFSTGFSSSTNKHTYFFLI